MTRGELRLSMREADRAGVIRQVVEKRLKQREAADRLGLSVRQVKRLAARYRERGAAGLVSGHRGKRSNNAIDAAVRREVLDLVRERYWDFGDVRAREAGGGAWLSAVGGDLAAVDDGGGAVAVEGAPGAAFASEPSAARGGPGADRRFAARLVRGARAGLHADRVRGRATTRRGDCVHEDDARASRDARPAGGVLTGCSRDRADAVRSGAADAGHSIHAHSPQAKGRVFPIARQPDAAGPA